MPLPTFDKDLQRRLREAAMRNTDGVAVWAWHTLIVDGKPLPERAPLLLVELPADVPQPWKALIVRPTQPTFRTHEFTPEGTLLCVVFEFVAPATPHDRYVVETFLNPTDADHRALVQQLGEASVLAVAVNFQGQAILRRRIDWHDGLRGAARFTLRQLQQIGGACEWPAVVERYQREAVAP